MGDSELKRVMPLCSDCVHRWFLYLLKTEKPVMVRSPGGVIYSGRIISVEYDRTKPLDSQFTLTLKIGKRCFVTIKNFKSVTLMEDNR